MEKIISMSNQYDQQVVEIWDLLADGWHVKMIIPLHYGGQSSEGGGAFIVLEK